MNKVPRKKKNVNSLTLFLGGEKSIVAAKIAIKTNDIPQYKYGYMDENLDVSGMKFFNPLYAYKSLKTAIIITTKKTIYRGSLFIF